jgi:iron complex outermembrane recepter protein
MKNFLISRASLIALGAATMFATPVYAQDAGEETPADGDIVVTANRDSSLLSKTPIAMSAVTGEGLRDAGITNPTQLADSVPNLSIDRTNGLQITIRGVTSTDGTEKGDPSAAFLLDGVYIARQQAQEVSFFDLERVEVLRGPQGTLFGRNTTAGLINVITNRPSDEFEASFDGAYGNYNAIQATGMINVPLGEKIAIRAGVNYDARDSYVIPGFDGAGVAVPETGTFKKNLSGRLSVQLKPTERLTVLVRGDYSTLKGEGTNTVRISNFFQTPLANPSGLTAATIPTPMYIDGSSAAHRTFGVALPAGQDRLDDNKTYGIHGEINYELSDSLNFDYVGSYRKFKRNELLAGYFGSVILPDGTDVFQVNIGLPFTGDYRQNSQEIRLSYKSDKLKLQVGGYYFREASEIALLIFGLQGAPGERGFVYGFPQATVSKSLAAFGQMTYSFTDALRFTAGARYTKDNKSRVGATIFHVNASDPLDFTTGPNAIVNPNNYSDELNNAAVKYSKVTWRAGLEFDANDRTLLFGTVSTGYKAGGFNDGCLAGTTNCNGTSIRAASVLFYSPETITSYEAGFKTRFADNAVRLNGTVFHYDYKNLQISQVSTTCGGPCQVTSNASSAKVDGVELEAILAPSSNDKFDFSASYLKARYSDFVTPPIPVQGLVAAIPAVSFTGRDLDRSPRWVMTAGYNHTFNLGNGGNIVAGVRTKMSASYKLISTAIRAQFEQPSYTKTDATVTYNAADDKWYVQGFVKNIENAVTLSSAAVTGAFPGLNGGTASFQDPRTYGVRAGFKF